MRYDKAQCNKDPDLVEKGYPVVYGLDLPQGEIKKQVKQDKRTPPNCLEKPILPFT